MNTHSPAELLRLWARGELTGEQAIGHLLQNFVLFVQRQADLDKRLRQVEQRLDKLQG